ncbi:MAG: sulfite exporter TauE/SafE family protein [bacterium]|nr:sulfite exporter TauE/SafE family protein [bacterium]
MSSFFLIAAGLIIGILASFSGLGGGFLVVPLLFMGGFSPQKAVGTSFFVIVAISLSALAAQSRFGNVDWKTGLFLAIGGIAGAQIGSLLLQHVPVALFRKFLSFLLAGLAVYLFLKR